CPVAAELVNCHPIVSDGDEESTRSSCVDKRPAGEGACSCDLCSQVAQGGSSCIGGPENPALNRPVDSVREVRVNGLFEKEVISCRTIPRSFTRNVAR